MARKRLVSPEFFKHAELYDLEMQTGLPVAKAYQGLWCQADRRGLFGWRPVDLRLEIFPYGFGPMLNGYIHVTARCHTCVSTVLGMADVMAEMLEALCAAGFIAYYEVDGRAYGCIPRFASWQTFHPTEKANRHIPEPLTGTPATNLARPHRHAKPCEHLSIPVIERVSNVGVTPVTVTVTDTVTVKPTVVPPRSRSGAKKAVVEEKAWPDFGLAERRRCIEAFRRVGDYHAGRVINAVAPFFRPATDPAYVPHDLVAFAVEDYCGIIGRGQSARFAGPEDCAKKLQLMAQNCVRYADDALGRFDAQMVAVHGNTRVAA